MLLHIDGCKHQWFGDERWYNLIVILDDATSEIYYAQLVEEESTRTVMAGLREVIETQGLFCALYSDLGSHFLRRRRPARSGQTQADASGASPEGVGSADGARRLDKLELRQVCKVLGVSLPDFVLKFDKLLLQSSGLCR
jgi:hypothetical protein